MERLRQLWVESGKSFEQGGISVADDARPPPLRTSSTYDDDEAFNNVALNLLSRHEKLGLSAKEAIVSTLVNPKQRASFFEGLCVRMDRSQHCSPVTESLLQSIQAKFGQELKDLVQEEGQEGGDRPCYSTKPATPRATTTTRASSDTGDASSGVYHHPTGQKNHLSTYRHSQQQEQKQAASRMFFPDSSNSNKGSSIGFFRKRRRVQNIDWKLVQAIKCVESLRLDGDVTPPRNGGGNYVPPSSAALGH